MRISLTKSGQSEAMLLADALVDIANQSAEGSDLNCEYVIGVLRGAEDYINRLKGEINAGNT